MAAALVLAAVPVGQREGQGRGGGQRGGRASCCCCGGSCRRRGCRGGGREVGRRGVEQLLPVLSDGFDPPLHLQ